MLEGFSWCFQIQCGPTTCVQAPPSQQPQFDARAQRSSSQAEWGLEGKVAYVCLISLRTLPEDKDSSCLMLYAECLNF